MQKKIKVILQARTGSKRLYGKVLLPICGISLVVLCWKRLKKKNFDITVAIPKNKEDNKLAIETIEDLSNTKSFSSDDKCMIDQNRNKEDIRNRWMAIAVTVLVFIALFTIAV